MPTFSSVQIPPPANWQDFEQLCCDLWRAIWNDPNTRRHGRQGQPQCGVDVFGRPDQKDKYAGVQCKGKDNYTNKRLTKREVKAEVEKAKSFKPALSEFIIATTGPKDAKIEELARVITQEHLEEGLFSVDIWFWRDDIQTQLADYPNLVAKYFPQFKVGRQPEHYPWPRMHAMEYFAYLNILGIEELAKRIAENRGIGDTIVRDRFIDVINRKVNTIQTGGIAAQYYGENGWHIATDNFDKMLRSISEVLDHDTEFRGYEKIPLEFVIGTAKDKRAKLSSEKLVEYYHRYKWRNDQEAISTSIILSESIYQELEPLEKKMCTKLRYTEMEISFFAADLDKVLKRGKVLEFLEKIGYPSSKIYGKIDEVYVPPVEYVNIKKTLKEKRIVFITGTQESGKTYTAVRLMWEYFNQKYEPKWVKGGEKTERIEVRKRLEDIEKELRSNSIIYFEDPFGKTKYEKRESLEREIGTIMDSVKQVEDTYVILTSREEVFKEFEKEKLSKNDIREFEQNLNLKKPSYDYERRKKILRK